MRVDTGFAEEHVGQTLRFEFSVVTCPLVISVHAEEVAHEGITEYDRPVMWCRAAQPS